MQFELELRDTALVLLVQQVEILDFGSPNPHDPHQGITHELGIVVGGLSADEPWFSKQVVNFRVVPENVELGFKQGDAAPIGLNYLPNVYLHLLL